mmetsp:Transcript_21737/g.64770  ORF Transcript_21737/g.64770 Transcript_21737/m.64770 type:complete len:345 (+) Transcript_21737:875-1909(+)
MHGLASILKDDRVVQREAAVVVRRVDRHAGGVEAADDVGMAAHRRLVHRSPQTRILDLWQGPDPLHRVHHREVAPACGVVEGRVALGVDGLWRRAPVEEGAHDRRMASACRQVERRLTVGVRGAERRLLHQEPFHNPLAPRRRRGVQRRVSAFVRSGGRANHLAEEELHDALVPPVGRQVQGAPPLRVHHVRRGVAVDELLRRGEVSLPCRVMERRVSFEVCLPDVGLRGDEQLHCAEDARARRDMQRCLAACTLGAQRGLGGHQQLRDPQRVAGGGAQGDVERRVAAGVRLLHRSSCLQQDLADPVATLGSADVQRRVAEEQLLVVLELERRPRLAHLVTPHG